MMSCQSKNHAPRLTNLFYRIVLDVLLLFTQGTMPQEGRSQVHNKRVPLLQLGSGHQRGGCRGYREGERERVKDWLDEHEP